MALIFKKFLCFCRRYLVFFLLLFSLVLLTVNARLSASFLDGLNLFITSVLPALFPYLFLKAIFSGLSATTKIASTFSPLLNVAFKTNGMVSYAFLMSIISGYPIGSKTVSDLYQNKILSHTEAVRASVLCSTSSPAFLISCVGNFMFKSTLFGALIYAVNVISAITVGVLYRFYKPNEKPTLKKSSISVIKYDNLIYDTVYSSVISTLIVGALISLFYLFTEALVSLNVLTPIINGLSFIFKDEFLAKGVTFGLFEYTKGLKTIASSSIKLLSLPSACFLSSFGGLCVLTQSAVYLKKAKIKIAPFLLAKILSAILSFVLGLILSFLFF